jgi:hypothetical protein
MIILYYLGITQAIASKVAWLMQSTMGTTAIETLGVAGNIFLNGVSAPKEAVNFAHHSSADGHHAYAEELPVEIDEIRVPLLSRWKPRHGGRLCLRHLRPVWGMRALTVDSSRKQPLFSRLPRSICCRRPSCPHPSPLPSPN